MFWFYHVVNNVVIQRNTLDAIIKVAKNQPDTYIYKDGLTNDMRVCKSFAVYYIF